MAKLKFTVEKWAIHIGPNQVVDEQSLKDAWGAQLRGYGFSGITTPRIEYNRVIGKMIRYPGVNMVVDDMVHTIIIDEEKFKAGKVAVSMEILNWSTEIENMRAAAKSCRNEAARKEIEAHRLLLQVDQIRSQGKEYDKKADVLAGIRNA